MGKDTIADLLTSIRNADMNKKGPVRVVSLNITENIVKILLREGFKFPLPLPFAICGFEYRCMCPFQTEEYYDPVPAPRSGQLPGQSRLPSVFPIHWI
uniref:Small ribosomal subunit protein uS8c n=1 Tax=Aegilops tauschii subsp. strangulata TaxID=200361 RepID=A0A453R7V1_AEGTS